MPNHFHLLIQQMSLVSASKMMQYLTNGYVLYFNERHRISGRLFQERFQAVCIETEQYLTHLSRYIHLNPLDIGCSVKDLHHYPWSSYPDYIGVRNGSLPRKDVILKEFLNIHDYRGFVEAGADLRIEKNMEKYAVDW
jgi:hypothetical protein